MHEPNQQRTFKVFPPFGPYLPLGPTQSLLSVQEKSSLVSIPYPNYNQFIKHSNWGFARD